MNVQTLRAMFLAFVQQPTNTVESFLMSDDQRALTQQPGQTYPQLQIDPPRFTPRLTPGRIGKKVYRTTAAIIAPAAKDDFAAQDRLMVQLETQMDLLIGFLDRKRKAQDARIVSIGEVFPITYGEHASLFGWAVPVDVESVSESFCVSPEVLHEVQLWEVTPTAGESSLGITVDATTYSVPYTETDGLVSRIDSLVSQINAGGHTLSATRDLESLLLTADASNTSITATPAAGHAWTITTI